MDNSYFKKTSYKWGMDPGDLEQTVACSAARGFYSSYSYVKMKVDEPLIVRVGYTTYEGSSTAHRSPSAFGWGLPVTVLIQDTGATALAMSAAIATSAAMLF